MSMTNDSNASTGSWFFPCIVAVLLALVAAVARGAEPYDLSPAGPTSETSRVTIELEVGGDLVAKDLMAPTGEEPKKLPLSVTARLDYCERSLSRTRSVRHYETAEATIKSPAGVKAPRLARDRRVIVAQRSEAGRIGLSAPAGSLSRDELDLIDIVGDARALDELLPRAPVEEDESWEVEKQAMGALLGLDSVAVCEVSCTIKDANKAYVRFELAGAVHGVVDAAATEFDVRAVGLYNRSRQRVTNLNLALTENRAIGPATPGLEATAQLKIQRTKSEEPRELNDAELNKLARAERSEDLELEAGRMGFRVEHDRSWFLAGEASDSVTLRRIDLNGLVAQTTFKRVAAKAPNREPTLESFEEEVRFSLGKSLRELVSNEQWTNQSGCRVMGLVARGKASKVEVEWRYYLVMPPAEASSDQKHMVSLATTVEQSVVEDVGKADRELADRLELIKPIPAASGVAGRSGSKRR